MRIEDILESLDNVLNRTATRKLTDAIGRLQQKYRATTALDGEKSRYAFLEDFQAYVACRMPACLNADVAVMEELADRRGRDWKPSAIMDLGAGPGTATWAAMSQWPEIERLVLIEREERFIELGQELQSTLGSGSASRISWLREELTEFRAEGTFDLVVCSYVLGELPEINRALFLTEAWEASADILMLVEPGTSQGFRILRDALNTLRFLGGRLLAPCPHDGLCPLPQSDWCYFSRRLPRSSVHRRVKNVTLGYEDEKYFYLLVSHGQGARSPARVIEHPLIRKGHVQLRLCTPRGLVQSVHTRSEPELYRAARHSIRGSSFPHPQD